MSKIPTAEEFLKSKGIIGERGELRKDQLVYLTTEFAKLHVKAQREAILNKAQLYEDPYTHCPECGNASTYIDEQSIINAYPESNIK